MSNASNDTPEPNLNFEPMPEAAAKAKSKRIFALCLWAVAIILELVAIFWLLRPSFDELVAAQGFPQWRWWTLLWLPPVMQEDFVPVSM